LKDHDEVVKHSAAIHIQNNITLLQRRAWNVLLANAYDALPFEEKHGITVVDLTKKLEFDSKNDDYLKEALEALVGCKVKWNVLDKDNKWEWGVTTLLAYATIKDGLCTYSYSPPLRERLHNPNIYARISLSMQNKFDSKHALALWELCLDYLDRAKQYGETPWIPLETFRELMGIAEEMYPEFKKLNKWVIKDPITAINEVTDFRVDVEYRRQSRKISAVKFSMRRMLQLVEQIQSQDLSCAAAVEAFPPAVQELHAAGFSLQDARDIWQRGFTQVEPGRRPVDMAFATYVREKIHLLRRQPAGKIKNTTGFLLNALRKNYTNPEFVSLQHTEALTAHRKMVAQLQKDKEQVANTKQEHLHQLCQNFIDTTPHLVEGALQEFFVQEPFYHQLYDRTRTLQENYQAHVFLSARIDTQLIQKYPEHFHAVTHTYEQRLGEIEQQIAALTVHP
jgi:hypothetical protein